MPTVHARTVRRAAEILGGIDALAAHLEARGDFIEKWMEGQLPVPQEVFLRCVDIVNAHQLGQISGANPNNSIPKDPS